MSDTMLPEPWSPITDLSEHDVASASDELRLLADVWLEEHATLTDSHALREFNERLQREWAIETGILERLYSLDRGVTQLLIERGIDATLIPHGATDQPPELVARVIQDQHSAVDFLFDIVAKRRPLSVSFIKELHALMTRNQVDTVGIDGFGHEVRIRLEHGEFKHWNNNPTRPDGRIHFYCPPEQVDSEMDRLLTMHARHMSEQVAPDVEAAWLHHRFTQIHPFQDGNGRIARALASLVFICRGWFPLVINRDDRVTYLDALEVADAGDLAPLVALFAAKQKRAFVAALGIAREVTQEGQRLDQQLAAISELFSRRDQELREELEQAKQIASKMLNRAVRRLNEVAGDLEQAIGALKRERRVFVDSATSEDPKRSWHRWQVIHAARELGYYAGMRDFMCWARLGIETESGRSEILVALHEIGPEYRGVVGGSVSFYRRQESQDGERHAIDLQAVSEDVFQINYKETESVVQQRFDRWLDRSLIQALDVWRRGE